MAKTWRILLSFTGIMILALFLWRSPPKPLQELIITKQVVQYPIAYIINSTTTQFDEEGSINYTLETELIRFYEPTKATHPDVTIEMPKFTFFDRDPATPPWELSSLSAQGKQKQDELLLKDNVLLIQRRNENHQTLLSTSELLIQPQRRYAETNKAVIITDENGQTEATGMKFFLDDERIELLSEVKGIYRFK